MSELIQQTPSNSPESDPGREHIPHHHRRRRRKRRRYNPRQESSRHRLVVSIFAGLFAFVCVVVVFILPLGASRRIEQLLRNGQWHINRAVAAITEKPFAELTLSDFEEADQHLLQAEVFFRQAQDDARTYAPLLGLLGGDAKALPHLLEIAVNASLAGQELYAGMEPLLTLVLAGPDNPALAYRTGYEERIIAPLLAGQPRLIDAREHLAEALAASQKIDRATLSDNVAATMDEVAVLLPRLYTLADTLVDAPELLTNLLGLREPKVYLMLAQNNDELRPTGGWVGTFGVVVIEEGQIVDFEYHSTSPPNLAPPDEECPVESPAWWIQLQEPVWGCWDAQWTADFPTLAGQAEWFYESGENSHVPVDGVIAIDLSGAETLLAVLGEVEVPDYGEVINAGNMRTRVYYYRSLEGEQPHKQFLASLFQTIVSNLVEIPPGQGAVILDALRTSLIEKHLLFYFHDPGLAALAAEMGMDGAISPTTSDYLFVVDSSLTTKAYSSIEENIEYEVIINPDGSLTGRATVGWFFPSGARVEDPAIAQVDWDAIGREPEFLDFARVYIPPGSAWSGTEGNDSPTQFAEEGGKLMLGNRVLVELGESKQIRHHYLVPDMIRQVGERSYYRLIVQKQPGTRGHWLTVRVILPKGAELVGSTPEASSVYELRETVVEFRTRLVTDQIFEVVFRKR
ncbi:MAG: DUF4012 domain-containing protein [Anaerolineales bacterium]